MAVYQQHYHSCKVSPRVLNVKCFVRLTQWQYVRFIILTQLYKLFPPAGNCHHLLIFYISNIINASQEQGRARWFIDQAVFLFTHSRAQHSTADIDQSPHYAKFSPRAGQVRLNYRILDTLIAPGPGVIDQQSISNEYYPLPTTK